MAQTLLKNNAKVYYQYETLGNIINSEIETNCVTTNIIEANLNILKTSSQNYFAPGDKITYNLYISNNTFSTLYNLVIAESSFDYFSYIEDSAFITYPDGKCTSIPYSNNLNCEQIPSSGNIVSEDSSGDLSFGFKIGNLEPNSNLIITYSVKINNNESLPNQITSSSIAYYSLTNSLSATRFSVQSNECVITKAFAQLSVSKQVDKETALCGDTLCYKIFLSNSGNIDATNVRIYDHLPIEFRLNNVKFKIADLPYNISYNVDDNNLLSIPASDLEEGLCIPANTDDNCISIYGTIDCI